MQLRPPQTWRALVPVVCLVAGFGFAVSAHDSRGTDLRPPGTANLRDLVRSAEARVRGLDAAVRRPAAPGHRGDPARPGAATARSRRLQAAGRAAARAGRADRAARAGPDRRPRRREPAAANAATAAGVDPNQLVVHQSDLQAVVNALWAGGAEAMTIAGQRVIATSAVRCVGNTLLLNGEVFSPPVPGRGHRAVPDDDVSARCIAGRQAVQAGRRLLRPRVHRRDRPTSAVPAYTGSITLQYAHVAQVAPCQRR